ncbi:MAG: PTS sugar transporter subunit IIA, partial [Deltaproteobacteria bacterium]
MKLEDFLDRSAVCAGLTATTKEGILRELAGLVAPRCPGLSADRLFETLLERERLGSTGLSGGLAIPHGRIAGLERIVGAFGRSEVGLDFGALDGQPSRLFFALFAPEKAGGDHLKALARVS